MSTNVFACLGKTMRRVWAPGSYFDMPSYFRTGMGGDTEMTLSGFERIGLPLDQCELLSESLILRLPIFFV